ncbi:HAD hydrolase-like protein [Bordetella trematum]|uniref:HAD hydrolase-like protein n=1 Tax=Bordetella trematum TaxID=123899 RepID=UPI00052F3FF1|nr:HAD hydrolase-like protein [Bordetella trematum]
MNPTPTPRYSLAAFDFDGTLADSLPWLRSVLTEAAGKFGFRAPDAEEVEQLRGHDVLHILKQLDISLWKAPALLAYMRQAQAAGGIGLFDGIGHALQTLHRGGLRLAVLSSNAEANVRAALGPALTPLISDFACGTDIFGKAAKMAHLLRHNGLPPQQAILIGDELRDIDAAREAGVASGAVAWGYNRADALAARHPDLLFNQVSDLAPSLLAPA